MTASPTKAGAALLRFMTEYRREHGIMPTFREMAAGIDVRSTSRIVEIVDSLVARGLVRRGAGATSRSLEIVALDERSLLTEAEMAALRNYCRRVGAQPDRVVGLAVEQYMREFPMGPR